MSRTLAVIRNPGPTIVSRAYSTVTNPTALYSRVTGAVNS